ncbi:MAG: CRISPR-associated endoribonuclease Cas6 [Thermoplasmata archaeon]|jgi:CRISPR-associated endoribonuclease Cas6
MRLIIEFEPTSEFSYDYINKHSIQGLIYYLLKNTSFDNLHSTNKFKYFTFSDIFPVSDFKPGQTKILIFSSPSNELVNTLYNSLLKYNMVRIKNLNFKIKNVKKIKLNLTNKFISGSPIVLYKDNKSNEYFSFEKHNNLKFFLERLQDNAIKKYISYTGDSLALNEPLFDKMIFKKEVVVKEVKGGKEFIIIGSVWRLLEKFYIPNSLYSFYEFIMDCGLGEKNSMGYGFINPVR